MRLSCTEASGLTMVLSKEDYAAISRDGALTRLFVAYNPGQSRGFVVIGQTPFEGARPASLFKGYKTREFPDYLRLNRTPGFPMTDLPLFSQEEVAVSQDGDRFLLSAPGALRVKRHVAKHQKPADMLPAVAAPEPVAAEPGAQPESVTAYMSVREAVAVINRAKRELGPGMAIFVAGDVLFVNFTLGGN